MRALGSLLIIAAGSLGLSGCSSGQTGSPSCARSTSCVCDSLYSYGTLLRVQVEGLRSGRLEAMVRQSFKAPDAAPSDVEDGDRIAGSLGSERPCDRDAPSSVQVGAELLVLYSAGTDGDYPNCSDFHACANADCSGLEQPALSDCWSNCEARTEQVCADHRRAALTNGHFSWAVAWQEPLDFGASHQLSTGDVEVLTSTEACWERFPAPPPPPCNDTPGVGQCGAAPLGSHPSAAGVWPSLLLVFALTGLMRRAQGARSSAQRT